MSKNYKKLKCSACILFAMCLNKQSLRCSHLYNYLYDDGNSPSSTYYYRRKVVEDTFKKKVRYYVCYSEIKELEINWFPKNFVRRDFDNT